MKFSESILEEVTNGILNDFFAVAYMIWVMLYGAKRTDEILMGRAKYICLAIWVIWAVDLRERFKQIFNMLVDLIL
jgi:hypothetical protein